MPGVCCIEILLIERIYGALQASKLSSESTERRKRTLFIIYCRL